jgi:phosphoribosyl-ATP pyrophosphohydrolase
MSQILHDLFTTIENRKQNPPRGSYTSHLFDKGEDEILKKLGEEVIEVIVAAKGQGDERLVSELADLLYHALVLLAVRNLQLADVEAELANRMK